jgi:hypothetical protein
MRRASPELQRSRDARYPLSALNVFRQSWGGYLIDGSYYRRAFRDGTRYYVSLDSALPESGTAGGADFVSGEVRVTSPRGAAESAIAINPGNTQELVAGSNGPGGGQRMHYSTDGGETWTQVDLPLGDTCCDPTVEWSSDGTYAYTAALGGCFIFFCELWFYRSDDGGATWTSLETETPGDPRRELGSQADREYMHVDQSPASPHQDNIYIMWHSGNVMRMSRSTDFGHTWNTVVFPDTTNDRGIAGDIATDRAGNIYYAWPAFNSRTIRLRKSTNGGLTFGATTVVATTQASFNFPIPAMDAREAAVYVAADADLSDGPYADSVYLAWTDATAVPSSDPASNHAWIRVAYSRDGGASWTLTTPHETDDLLTVDRWQTFLAVGPDGTVHVIYYDTRRAPDRRAADLFYAYSTDGAQTWSEPQRITSEQSPNIADGFEFGDYSGLDIVMDDLVAIFTDNRDETGGSNESVDVYAAGITPGGSAVCGNNAKETGEECDGIDLAGLSCADFDCAGGELACAGDCLGFDTSGCTGCAGVGAGRVPGGRSDPGAPLLLTKAGGDLALAWAPACGSVTDYAVYEGELGLPASAVSSQCSTGGLTETTLTPSAGSRFYLVVATSDGAEGSYGLRADDTERPAAASPCFPQSLGACP